VPQKVLSENLSPISLSATMPSRRRDAGAGPMERAGEPHQDRSRARFVPAGFQTGLNPAHAFPKRRGFAAVHSAAREINSMGPSPGRQRAPLLRYYSVKTKQLPKPSSVSLAQK